MDWIQALIMGVVQGLAEYLPISSSGHLEICRSILGIDLPGDEALAFSLTLHVATVLSTIVVLWREFLPLCNSFFTMRKDANTIYVLKILLSCVPVGIVGLCFKDFVEQFFGGGLLIVGICLMITALLLCLAYWFSTRPVVEARQHDITWWDAFIIGCSQAVAVLPGLSRSGTTIATGLLLGDRRDRLAQFSFFMVIIPILGEGLLDLKKMVLPSTSDPSPVAVELVPLLVGFVAAFVVGCVACKWMIELVKRGKLVWFAIYCAIVGALCVMW